jgi:hypothetical protein
MMGTIPKSLAAAAAMMLFMTAPPARWDWTFGAREDASGMDRLTRDGVRQIAMKQPLSGSQQQFALCDLV